MIFLRSFTGLRERKTVKSKVESVKSNEASDEMGYQTQGFKLTQNKVDEDIKVEWYR